MVRSILACAVMLAGAGEASAGSSCLPREVASVEVLGKRLTLTESQRRWLEESFAMERLGDPDDLWGCPDADAGLVQELTQALCWGSPRRVESQTVWSTLAQQREQRVRFERGRQWVALRAKERAGQRSLSGGASLHWRRFSLRAGHLTGRWGLGLLASTPGGQSRGRGPQGLAFGGWRVTTWEGAVRGASLAWEGESARAWLTRGFPAREAPGEAALLVSRETARWGVLWKPERGVSVLLEREGESHGAGLEWVAPLYGDPLWGAVYHVRLGPWRVKGSAVRTRHQDRPRDDLRWEVRLSLPGGSVRTAGGLRLDEDGDLATKGHGEIEAVWKPARGWRFMSLWRRQESRDLSPRIERMRVVRYTVDWNRKPWSVLVRIDERTTASGSSLLAEFRAGREWSRLRLEIRARDRTAQGDDPGLFGYRRRPGALFDLERVPLGRQWGVWIEGRRHGVRLELSADVRPGAWEAAAALHLWWEGID